MWREAWTRRRKDGGWRGSLKSEVWSEWLLNSDKNKVTNREGPEMKDVNKLKVDSSGEAAKWIAQPAGTQGTRPVDLFVRKLTETKNKKNPTFSTHFGLGCFFLYLWNSNALVYLVITCIRTCRKAGLEGERGLLWATSDNNKKAKECYITVTGWITSTALVLQLHFPFCFLLVAPTILLIAFPSPPPLHLSLFSAPLFLSCFRRCTARRRWRAWGRSWSGRCPGSWAVGSPTPSPGPACTLWAPTRHGPAPASHWCYWFAAGSETIEELHRKEQFGVLLFLLTCLLRFGWNEKWCLLVCVNQTLSLYIIVCKNKLIW